MDLDTTVTSFPSDTEVLQEHSPSSEPASGLMEPVSLPAWVTEAELMADSQLIQALAVIHHNPSLPTRAKYKVQKSMYTSTSEIRLLKSACFVPTRAN